MQLLTTGLKSATVPFDLAFSPDGRRLAVNTGSSGVAVLEPPATPPIAILSGSSRFRGVGFTADGRVVRGSEGGVQLFDPDHCEVVATIPTKERCTCVAVSADGQTIWAGTRDRNLFAEIHCWRVGTEQRTTAFARHRGYLQGLAVSAAGDLVASFQSAGEVRVWRLGGKKLPRRAAFVGRVESYESVQQIDLARDGQLVAGTAYWVRNSVCPVYVWDTQTGQQRFRLEVPFSVAGIAFHPTRPLLVTAGDGGNATFWDMQTGREIVCFTWPTQTFYAVAFAPDGGRCAAAANGVVVVWDVD